MPYKKSVFGTVIFVQKYKKVDLFKNRTEVYKLLAYAYLNKPSKKLLQSLNQTKSFFQEIIDAKIPSYKKEDLKDIVQEYYDRFFIPKSGIYVPPFESAIKNRTYEGLKVKYGGLDSNETVHVKACYEIVDFKPEELEMFEPLRYITFPDHIAYEIAFMAYLCESQHYALSKGEKENVSRWSNLQKQFLQSHLGKWIRDLSSLTKSTKEGFYSYLTDISASWVEFDLYFLDELKLN